MLLKNDCARLRQIDKGIPITFYSGAADGSKQAALDAGAHSDIMKPAGVDEVINVIVAAVGSSLKEP